MKTKLLIAALLSLCLAPIANSDVVVGNNFEAGLSGDGTEFYGSDSVSFSGLTQFSSAPFTSVSGLGGSSLAGNFTSATGQNYEAMLDIPTVQLVEAGMVFDDPSLTTTVSFDYEIAASTTTVSYNGIAMIANTDTDDGNSYQQGANGLYFSSGASSGNISLDITDLLAFLNPAVNPTYSNIKFVSNKDADSTVDITFDNIVVTQIVAVPEPSSLALTSLFGFLFLRRRK